MKLRTAACCLLVVGWPAATLGIDLVTIESRTVSVAEPVTSVGVFITNDRPLSAIVLPLVVRSATPGVFIRDSLRMNVQGRLTAWDTNSSSYITKRYYAAPTGIPLYRPPNCVPDSAGKVWRNATPNVDFVSPDAMMYVAVGIDSMDTGSDGTPEAGVPSIVLQFGLVDEPGVIEIDTTCVSLANRLALVDMGGNVVPTGFQKSTITLVEPTDTMSGHVSDDLNLRGTVYLSGDLTIDSGVTVSVRRGTSLIAVAGQDDQSSGSDTGLVEIIVRGTLAIDSFPGDRPYFRSDSGAAGSWHGLRVVTGGRLESGVGAAISDAVVGLRIDAQTAMDTLSDLTVTNCDSVGISNGSVKVALIGDTVMSVLGGIGIYVDSGGPLIQDCYVESCGTGIKTYKSWSTIRGTKIVGPGTYGIAINNYGGLEFEGKERGGRVPASMAAEGQGYIVALKQDTASGYFSGAQFWMGRYSNRSTIDSCGFVHPMGSQRSPYGLYIDWSDTVTVRRSTVSGFVTSGVYSYKSKTDLGSSQTGPGSNSIYSDTAGCGGCLLRRVTHVGTDSLRAEGNWWGANPPLVSWFAGKVDYNPYLTEPLGKASAPYPDEGVASAVPRQHAIAQNYPNPFNSSTEIEFALASPEHVTVKVYNILGQVVRTLADRDYMEGAFRVTWNGTNDEGQQMASGIYLYRIEAGAFTQSKKMVLLK